MQMNRLNRENRPALIQIYGLENSLWQPKAALQHIKHNDKHLKLRHAAEWEVCYLFCFC